MDRLKEKRNLSRVILKEITPETEPKPITEYFPNCKKYYHIGEQSVFGDNLFWNFLGTIRTNSSFSNSQKPQIYAGPKIIPQNRFGQIIYPTTLGEVQLTPSSEMTDMYINTKLIRLYEEITNTKIQRLFSLEQIFTLIEDRTRREKCTKKRLAV